VADFYNNGGQVGGALQLWGATITNLTGTFSGNYNNINNVKYGGGAVANVYASGYGNRSTIENINGSFSDNYVSLDKDQPYTNAYGGGIYNTDYIGEIVANFTGNYAKSTGEYKAGAGGGVISADTDDDQGSGRAYGGAIFNIAQVTKDDQGKITGVVENTGVIDSISGNFTDNYVYSENGDVNGGAIYNEYGTIGSINGSFEGNKIHTVNGGGSGGAILNQIGKINYIGSSDNKAKFKNNTSILEASTSTSGGGAIMNSSGQFIDIYADFENNGIISAGYAWGGAIYTAKHATPTPSIGNLIGSFIGNYVEAEQGGEGGAIINAHGATIDKIVASFTNNYMKSTRSAAAGAITNMGLSVIKTIENSSFTGNYAISNTANAEGGAIKNTGTIGTLDGTTLLADNTGIINTSFTGNYVRGNDASTGGAIWNSGNINLTALQSDVNFWNNKANDRYNDIYNSGTMAFNAAQNKTMSFGGSIEGSGAININTGATNGGTYVFKSDVSAGNVVVGSADSGYAPASLSFEKATQEDGSTTNGTFDVASLTINGDGNSLSTRNDKVDTNSATTLTLNNALNLQIDGDLQSGKGDSLAVTNLTAAPKSLRLTAMNFTADPDVTTLSKTDTLDVDISGGESTLDGVYTLASTNPDDTTEEQIEQTYLNNLTSSSGNYNRTYAFRSAKLMTSGNNQTYVQYGDAITLKWLYENYINGWSGGNYILNNVTDGGNPDSTHLTVGQALTALDSALGKNDTYDFSTQSVANVLVNNYYTKLMKKDEKFDTNEGIMDVKSLKKDTNSSQGRIIKGVSAFPSIMCAYPFDMPHTANDNRKNVITRQTACCYAVDRVISANSNDSAEILWSSHRMTGKESIKMTGNATTTKQAA
jgi:hypothetical protein